MAKLCVCFVASLCALAHAKGGAIEGDKRRLLSARYKNVWRWPYAMCPYVVHKNERDGLPDFSFDFVGGSSLGLEFTTKTVQCPAELIELPTDRSKNCQDKIHGGSFCHNEYKAIVKNNLNDTIPHHKGSAADFITGNATSRTRRSILQRAIGWLAMHSPYYCGSNPSAHHTIESCAGDDSKECPEYEYASTCEGLTAMAYRSGGYAGGRDTKEIDCMDLMPGDTLCHSGRGKSWKECSHYMLFREWSNGKPKSLNVPTRLRLYQMGGADGSSNVATVNVSAIVDKDHPKQGHVGYYQWCPGSKSDPGDITYQQACIRCSRFKYINEE